MKVAIMEFRFSSTIEDEVSHVRFQLGNLEFFRAEKYDVTWPDALKAEIAQGIARFSDERLRDAIVRHDLPGASLERVVQSWRRVEDRFASDFVAQLTRQLPKVVRVHVTKFGPGGSHDGASMAPRLVVSYPEMKGLDFNSVLVHEFIEVLLWRKFRSEEARLGKRAAHAIKEAVVDRFCSCDNLKPVVGSYRKQASYSQLPPDWEDWLPAKGLTWSQ
ncbi:hypothetical protein [Bradyrhizobium sp. HKCCYLRH1030]|uniref:hypothetical protein n=1 Tax=Bradyrhizobium sp. HKCCYLRH1030 TaxID=3420744 RepID=UPI003EBDDB04